MAEKKRPTGYYEVGYGKPPKEHLFKPRQSGNLRGRPKSRKSGLTDISGLLNEPVKVKAGGKVREMGPYCRRRARANSASAARSRSISAKGLPVAAWTASILAAATSRRTITSQ